MRLYHGSYEQVAQPRIELCRDFNDYGRGFYCTQSKQLANEWACQHPTRDGFCNRYDLDETGLRFVDLDQAPFTPLNWIAVLMQNRPFSSEWSTTIVPAFVGKYGVDLSDADVVMGWRADDSYFSIARSFAAGTFTVGQTTEALRLGSLGKQVVLRSPKAFRQLTFIGSTRVPAVEWYPKWAQRDAEARAAFRVMGSTPDINGVRIFDLLSEEAD